MFCKSCGYELVGIASGRCPECAREFDPADLTTFDQVPRRTRLRRRLKRLAVAFAVLVVLVVVFPRGYARCRLALSPPNGVAEEFVRVQLAPPIWLAKLGVTYPGWTRRMPRTDTSQSKIFFTASASRFTLRGSQTLGTATASADGGYGTMALNDVIAIPENAEAVFRTIIPDMFADRSYGVSIGSRTP